MAPGVYDGLSARVAVAAGAESVDISGGALARSTGTPDLGILTMTKILGRVRQIVDAVDEPVIAEPTRATATLSTSDGPRPDAV